MKKLLILTALSFGLASCAPGRVRIDESNNYNAKLSKDAIARLRSKLETVKYPISEDRLGGVLGIDLSGGLTGSAANVVADPGSPMLVTYGLAENTFLVLGFDRSDKNRVLSGRIAILDLSE